MKKVILFTIATALAVGLIWFILMDCSLTPVQVGNNQKDDSIKLTIRVISYSAELKGDERLLFDSTRSGIKDEVYLKTLWEKYAGKYANNLTKKYYDGPDYPTVEILLERGTTELRLRSWHPLFWNRPNILVTSDSIGAPPNEEIMKKRESADRAKSPEYYKFRDDFNQILAAAGVTKETLASAYRDQAEQSKK